MDEPELSEAGGISMIEWTAAELLLVPMGRFKVFTPARLGGRDKVQGFESRDQPDFDTGKFGQTQ
jgi:hypothetical protein